MQSSEVFPEGYNCYRKDRKDDTHGGVFVLVSDKYLSTEPPEFRVDGACELLWVKLQIQGLPDLYIGSFYRPPKTTDEAYLTALNHSISKVLYSRNCNVWLGGDFNLGGVNWQNSSVSTGARNSRNCQQLIDLTNDHGLKQMVKSPTHYRHHRSHP